MRVRNVFIALTALLPLGVLAPAAVLAQVSNEQPVPGDCTNVLVGAETEDNNGELLSGLFEGDDDEASANICLDRSFNDVRSANAGRGDDDEGLLGDVLRSEDGGGEEGLLGDVLRSDDRGGDEGLLGDVLRSEDGGGDEGLLGDVLRSEDGGGEEGWAACKQPTIPPRRTAGWPPVVAPFVVAPVPDEESPLAASSGACPVMTESSGNGYDDAHSRHQSGGGIRSASPVARK